MCTAFIGCGNTTTNDNTTKSQSTAVSETVTVTETVSDTTLTAEDSQTTAKEGSTDSTNGAGSTAATAKGEQSSAKATTQRVTTTSTETKKTTAATTAKAVTTAKATTTSAATKKAATTTTTTTTASTLTCTVEIECKQILNNMDKLSAGHEAYVPANGIIMSTCTVTVANGSSVYDALKIACSKNGVSINAQNSAYGTYIAGFNNLDEKDCGKQSGWLYSVNGKNPPKSCDKYTVSNGDVIVFSYTC